MIGLSAPLLRSTVDQLDGGAFTSGASSSLEQYHPWSLDFADLLYRSSKIYLSKILKEKSSYQGEEAVSTFQK
ncbi:unnamed protein product [Lasius platythorax]|uniref:Uncharacterized protein n=1 Tax=Lasius platythorax TaxID=488582 RepID=A0AAV2NHN9_9HYME